LYWAWWICWTPIVASYIARISHGRRMRDICVALLFIPLLLVGLLQLIPLATVAQGLASLLSNKPLLLIGLAAFIAFFLPSPHLNHIFYGYINNESVKKYRTPKVYLQVFPITLTCGIVFFKMLGYKLMGVLLLLSSLPALGIIGLMILSIYKVALKRNA
jgi:hypothetical protein